MIKERVFILGLGYVGLPLAIEAAKSGYLVTGFDVNEEKINELIKGISSSPEVSDSELLKLQGSGHLELTSILPKIFNPAIYIIAVPTPLDKNRNPDLEMLTMACDSISKVICEGSLVINESTSYIGTLNDLIRQNIVSASRIENLDFAVAPERIDPANNKWDLKTTPRIIGGLSERAVTRAINFYQKFCDHVHSVSRPEIAEAAKLFENTFRQVNIALVNELSSITHKFNISTHDVIRAASTKPYGFMPFYPSVGVGGHCIPIDPSYLTFSAKKFSLETKLIDLANEINITNPHRIALRIKKLLGGNLEGKKIQLVGISYKLNVSDIRESPALALISQLRSMGGDVIWHDPLAAEWNGELSSPLQKNIDLGIINVPHDFIDLSFWNDAIFSVIDISATTMEFGWAKFL